MGKFFKKTILQSSCNFHTLRKKIIKYSDIRVVIAYDCRHGSDTLSRIVAEILSANNITVSLFSSLRTTPELSFAVRHLGAQAGIVLTASHNPPEYNGYKVYWNDGGQLVPPHDKGIIDEVRAMPLKVKLASATTEIVPKALVAD